MKKTIVLFISFYLCPDAQSQPIYNVARSPYCEAIALTPHFTSSFTSAENPAALSYLDGLALGVYLEKKYMTDGLNLAELTMAYGKRGSGGGVAVRYFGNPLYNEFHASANYGKHLGAVSLGASFQYNAYTVPGFGRQAVVGMSLSSVYELSDKIYTGLRISNPAFAHLNSTAALQPAEYDLGFSFEPSPVVCMSMEFQKPENIPLQVNASVQYAFAERFAAKVGFFTSGPQPFFGIRWQFRDLDIEVAITYHPVLDSSPGLSFSYRTQREGDKK